jgi:nucleotide-binding universal stress UspA family protein
MNCYQAIVVGTDGSEAANETVRQGAELARLYDATLHIVAAYRQLTQRERERILRGGPAGLNTDFAADAQVAARAIVEDAAHLVGRGLRVALHTIKGDPAGALCQVAEREAASLILVGNRGAGNPLRGLFKPIYNRVQRGAGCEVKVIDTERFRRAGAMA